MRLVAFTVVLVFGVVSAGCAGGGGVSGGDRAVAAGTAVDTPVESSDTVASGSAAPRESGVLFDPCTIDAEVIRAAGFDATRQETTHGSDRLRGCRWRGLVRGLFLTVTTNLIDVEAIQASRVPIRVIAQHEVEGRRVVFGPRPSALTRNCELLVGSVMGGAISVAVVSSMRGVESTSVCERYGKTLAGIVEELISLGEI